MKLKVSQVIGLNTDQKAAQVVSSIQDTDNAFFAVLDLSCDDAFTKGRQFLSEISDFYFETEGTPSEKLNLTFTKAREKLAEKFFSLTLGCICGKVLYVIGKGETQTFLKRDDKLSSLMSLGESQLISGFLQENDKLLFATKTLVDFLADDLSKTLNLETENFEMEVTDRIGGATLEGKGLAAILVEVIKTEPEDILSLPVRMEDGFEERKVSALKPILKNIFKKILSLRSHFPKSGRGRLFVAVILIVIIVLGVGFKFKSSKDKQINSQFTQLIQQGKDDLLAAKGLSTLSPVDAKVKLDSAKDKVNKALILKPKNIEAEGLKKQIETDSSSVLQQASISEFPLFLDIDLVKKNFRATQMSLSSGKLLLMDPAVKTLVLIDIAKKNNQILAGQELLGDANGFSLNGGLAFVYSKDKGVIRIDITNQKITAVAKKDLELGNIADLYAFAGNVYLLDSIKNQIWKYLPTADSYSDKREYLSSDTKVDLSNSIRMQIESSVYIMKQGGEILRFTRGVKDNFSIGGLDKNIKDPKSFFVSSDSDNLYVLDSGNSRLLILTKIGAYKGQITGDKFAHATDLVVDEQGKKVYLLDGSKIYTVDLK